MVMVYGSRWIGAYGPKDDGTWLAGLCDVTPAQIKIGLEKCRTSADPWPPTLPQFRAMCRPARSTAAHRIIDGPLLPSPRADKSKALAELAKMRAVIDGQTA